MCISACPLARAHAHVCEWGLQGAGGTGRGGGGDVSLCVCVCVCVCVGGVNGRYLEGLTVRCVFVCVCVYMVAILEGLTVGGERESQVCVYSHVARYKGVASS